LKSDTSQIRKRIEKIMRRSNSCNIVRSLLSKSKKNKTIACGHHTATDMRKNLWIHYIWITDIHTSLLYPIYLLRRAVSKCDEDLYRPSHPLRLPDSISSFSHNNSPSMIFIVWRMLIYRLQKFFYLLTFFFCLVAYYQQLN